MNMSPVSSNNNPEEREFPNLGSPSVEPRRVNGFATSSPEGALSTAEYPPVGKIPQQQNQPASTPGVDVAGQQVPEANMIPPFEEKELSRVRLGRLNPHTTVAFFRVQRAAERLQ